MTTIGWVYKPGELRVVEEKKKKGTWWWAYEESKVTNEEVIEFLRTLKLSDYTVMEQLKKISIIYYYPLENTRFFWKILMSSMCSLVLLLQSLRI